jgi:8-oxo-dGTP pyrophosphatase MutT (NUDIX family)
MAGVTRQFPQPLDPMASGLREALIGPLPGTAAHSIALPEGFEPRAVPVEAHFQDAAVLIALYRDPERGRILFPLIRRPASAARHAGQISLPGGEREAGEGNEECALREAQEEVGIAPVDVTILGTLTPVEIPITRYRVAPIVGWLFSPPRYRLQESEVRGLLLADPDALAASGPTLFLERRREDRVLRFPAWDVEGEKVWGATAQILGEFTEVWRRVTPR